MTLKAPFAYFGGKSRVADHIWKRFGDIDHYVEPFFGSGATLLAAPYVPKRETVNDLDFFLVNVWRGIRACPDKVAEHLMIPIIESDQNARHLALMARKDALRDSILADPDFCDPVLAAYWIYGKCCWIGSGFCSGKGRYAAQDGSIVPAEDGSGVNFQLPKLTGNGQGILSFSFEDRILVLEALGSRLARTRVVCGDWGRIVKPSVIMEGEMTGVLLDPPYIDGCQLNVYANNSTVPAMEVQAWCLENGGRENLRIALCGYDGEHNVLEEAGWSVFEWSATGGFGNQGSGRGKDNRHRERIWFSPNCVVNESSILEIFGV